MPCSATAAPRMKLPPPMTIATSTPSACTLPISSARYFTYCGEMPNFRSPRSASPESFSRTRWYFAAPFAIRASLGVGLALGLSDGEALDAAHRDVLADRRGERRDEILDRLRAVADVRLVEKLVDRLRRHRGDLHCDLGRELLELRAARDEVRLARDLHERALPAARVDVRGDDAFLRFAARLLRDGREAALLQQAPRLLVVAVGVLERAFAVHDASVRVRAQALNFFGVDLLH